MHAAEHPDQLALLQRYMLAHALSGDAVVPCENRKVSPLLHPYDDSHLYSALQGFLKVCVTAAGEASHSGPFRSKSTSMKGYWEATVVSYTFILLANCTCYVSKQ
jgi:hypothetical protein